MSEQERHAIIDPTVGPYHSAAEIRAWLAELEAMPASVERDLALDQAKTWLAAAEERDARDKD